MYFRKIYIMKNMKNKNPTTIRFTPTARELVKKLSESLGVTRSAVIEMSIREKAKREGISQDAKGM